MLWKFCNKEWHDSDRLDSSDFSIGISEFNHCVGEFTDMTSTRQNGLWSFGETFLRDFHEKYWNFIDQDGSGVLEENEFRDFVIALAWIDARVMFKCDLEITRWTYYYCDDSETVMEEMFEKLNLKYTGNDTADSVQLAGVIIETWWSKSNWKLAHCYDLTEGHFYYGC